MNANSSPLLVVSDLHVGYKLPRLHILQARQELSVVKGVSFSLAAGASLGIVGESGSGKTTLGRAVLRLVKPRSGTVLFDGKNISTLSHRQLHPYRMRMQMIFQDPRSALNPRRKLSHAIFQALNLKSGVESKAERLANAEQLFVKVGLDASLLRRYPHELSGGQRQRAVIARALAVNPELIVADEIVSGLDMSSQARILNLLQELKEELGLTLIFISHDLSVIRALCDQTLVMQQGRVAEHNETSALFTFARHPYTRELIQAIPLPEIDNNWLDSASASSNYVSGGIAMLIKDSTVLVTGANRGIGKSIVAELVKRGAKKVYATARDPSAIDASAAIVEAHKLDITDRVAITELAAKFSDVDLLINNAGVNRMSAFAASDDINGAREEMEVNYFGTLEMCRAFAPVLKKNGGGVIVNMLSILARVNLPLMGSLCASKAAGLSLVQGLRAELAAQNTGVIAVMPGAVDTDMSRDFPPPKMPAAEVANAMLDGVEQGLEEIYPGEMADGLSQGLASDPKAVEKELAGYLPQ
ncbi:MAG: SDR family oxidoreductase [Gammaproteobacteria bacterium]|nr:SDR family oxidoreductase [Gammaproteobacteria bacterium]